MVTAGKATGATLDRQSQSGQIAPRQDRPKNRKQLIVAAAANLFERRGYHNVGISDIAAEVGITGPALYRHFGRKQDLLAATIEFEVGQLKTTYQNAPQDLRSIIEAATKTTFLHGHAAMLWQRENGQLEPRAQEVLRQHYREAIAPLRIVIKTARPDLDDASIDILLWATHAVFCSRRLFDRAPMDSRKAHVLMAETALRVCAVSDLPLGEADKKAKQSRKGRLSPASRREAALAAAVALFAERGYQSVGMDDIGAAAGITGPTLYHHFPGKSAILIAAVSRCLEAMFLDFSAALSGTDNPAVALERALESFVRINVEHGDAMSALVTEMVNIPADERGPIRRQQRDYVAEWATLLTRVRKDLTDTDAQVVVGVALTVVNTIRRVCANGSPSSFRDSLIVLGRAVLGLPAATSAD